MDEKDITNELKRLSRRIEEIGKTLDLLFKDREILEDVLTRLTAVENALHLQRSTQRENTFTITQDIHEIKDKVEAKVDEVQQVIEDKTVIVKAPRESVYQKILKRFKGGK